MIVNDVNLDKACLDAFVEVFSKLPGRESLAELLQQAAERNKAPDGFTTVLVRMGFL